MRDGHGDIQAELRGVEHSVKKGNRHWGYGFRLQAGAARSSAYETYCKWCESMDIAPASIDIWAKTNDSVSNGVHRARKELMLR